MNRKLIRTTLAEVKGKAREMPQPRERSNGSQRGSGGGEGSGREPRSAARSIMPRCSKEANSAADGNECRTLLLQEADRRAYAHGDRVARRRRN